MFSSNKGATLTEAQPLQTQPKPRLTTANLTVLHERLHDVAEQTIGAVSTEVPAYRGTLDASAQATLAQAVETALGGFLALAAADQDASAPLNPVLEGALVLGRVEAQQGRSMDALLAAYRVGARVAWRGLAGAAAESGLPAQDVVIFAELVFAYIDALSAASVSGHAAELAIADRARARALERLAQGLLLGAPEEAMRTAAQEAGWSPPTALAAVVLPASRWAPSSPGSTHARWSRAGISQTCRTGRPCCCSWIPTSECAPAWPAV